MAAGHVAPVREGAAEPACFGVLPRLADAVEVGLRRVLPTSATTTEQYPDHAVLAGDIVCEPCVRPDRGYRSRCRRSRDFLRFDATIQRMSGSSTACSRSKAGIAASGSAATATLQQ